MDEKEKQHTNKHGKNKSQTHLPDAESTSKIMIINQKIYEPTRITPDERKDMHKRYSPNPLLIIFNEESCKKIKKLIGWGNRTAQNRIEQGGILIGRVCRFRNEVFSFIEDCILADTQGSETFVEFSPAMWSEMQKKVDEINASRSENDQLIITGWFHTHPNNLNVFMSGTDQNTQNKNFSQDWQTALVLNPHRRILRGFFGKDINEATVVGWDSHNVCETAADSDGGEPNPFLKKTDSEYGLQKRLEENGSNHRDSIVMHRNQDDAAPKRLKRYWLIYFITVALFAAAFFGFAYYEKNVSNSSINVHNLGSKSTLQSEDKSLVFFQITWDAWTGNDQKCFCIISIREENNTQGGTKPSSEKHSIRCNSNGQNAYVYLSAGSYIVSFDRLPLLLDGTSFQPIDPIKITIDGKTPQVIPVVLKKIESVPTTVPEEPETTHLTDETSTQKTKSDCQESQTTHSTNETSHETTVVLISN